jgi:hypothetical protein
MLIDTRFLIHAVRLHLCHFSTMQVYMRWCHRDIEERKQEHASLQEMLSSPLLAGFIECAGVLGGSPAPLLKTFGLILVH